MVSERAASALSEASVCERIFTMLLLKFRSLVVFIQIRPSVRTRIRSVLFVRKTRGWLSVVPKKFVEALVLVFPKRRQSVASS
jgi:hypothetical protein